MAEEKETKRKKVDFFNVQEAQTAVADCLAVLNEKHSFAPVETQDSYQKIMNVVETAKRRFV